MSRIIENPNQLILDAAKKILFDKGYSELSMRNVAKECGIALGTIYNYFPTKKDLVVGMMSSYWEEFFVQLESLIRDENTFFVKLNGIFNELRFFVNNFKEVWLRPELYSTPDYVENGLAKENVSIERLIRRIAEFLESEASKSDPEIKLKLAAYDISKFIVMNFITIIQMPVFSYQSFEVFLKELIQ